MKKILVRKIMIKADVNIEDYSFQNNGIPINAEVNGSYQIRKKVFPNAFKNGVENAILHPIVVNIPA